MAEWSETHTSYGSLLRIGDLRLRELVHAEQPTVWIWAKQSSSGQWEAVDDESAQRSAGVRREKVLRDFDWDYVDREVLCGTRQKVVSTRTSAAR